jgi:hypothetical protein
MNAIPGIDVSIPPSGTGCVECEASEPGEDWFYDYPSSTFFDGPELKPPVQHPPDQSVPGPASRVPHEWRHHLH